MSSARAISSAVVMVAMAALLQAQQTQPQTSKQAAGAPQVSTASMTGEVVWIQGQLLVCKMRPSGLYRLFDTPPGRQFVIDGQPKLINELKLGTVLTATVITTTQPVTVRTTATLDGTVAWVAGNYVVLTLPNGENHDYRVPASFKFIVEGKPAAVTDLKIGMKVTATKITEEPRTEISTQTVVTGKAPK